jgi:hypothetical protein
MEDQRQHQQSTLPTKIFFLATTELLSNSLPTILQLNLKYKLSKNDNNLMKKEIW